MAPGEREEGQAAVMGHPTRTGQGVSPKELGCWEDKGDNGPTAVAAEQSTGFGASTPLFASQERATQKIASLCSRILIYKWE